MSRTWAEAAELYRRAKEVKRYTTLNREQEELSIRVKIDSDVYELELFMGSEDGRSACELLSASGRHINFGEERDGGGYGVVYFIDGKGLQQSVEAMGMWTAFSSDVKKPEISIISARQAIMAAVEHGGIDTGKVMEWLRSQLDQIANAAP